MSEDEDFWTTYTALTPDEDQRFAGCGRWLAWAIVAALAMIAVASLI
jgi:hypothetical protein